MNKQLRKDIKGFTIIEVLIVLAIAGLIMLVVFLAVPALQRNARNNALQADVSAIASGVNEFQTNNNGIMPTGTPPASPGPPPVVAFAAGGRSLVLSGPAGTSNVTVDLGGNIRSFDAPTGAAATDLVAGDNVGAVRLRTGVKCNPNGGGTTTATGASPRSYAIQSAVETSRGNTIIKCQ